MDIEKAWEYLKRKNRVVTKKQAEHWLDLCKKGLGGTLWSWWASGSEVPAWINQPSKLQPWHHHNGKIGTLKGSTFKAESGECFDFGDSPLMIVAIGTPTN